MLGRGREWKRHLVYGPSRSLGILSILGFVDRPPQVRAWPRVHSSASCVPTLTLQCPFMLLSKVGEILEAASVAVAEMDVMSVALGALAIAL